MKRKPRRRTERAERLHSVDGYDRTHAAHDLASPTRARLEKCTGHGAAGNGLTKSLLSRQIRPPPRTDHRRQPIHNLANRCSVLNVPQYAPPGTRSTNEPAVRGAGSQERILGCIGREHSPIRCGWSRNPAHFGAARPAGGLFHRFSDAAGSQTARNPCGNAVDNAMNGAARRDLRRAGAAGRRAVPARDRVGARGCGRASPARDWSGARD